MEEMRKESGTRQEAGATGETEAAISSATPTARMEAVGFGGLFSARYLTATLLAVGVQMAQQLTGINAIMFYSSDMFKRANVKPHFIQYAVCATGLIIVIVTIISVQFSFSLICQNTCTFASYYKFIVLNKITSK